MNDETKMPVPIDLQPEKLDLPEEIPPWFHNAVLDGVMAMINDRMPGAPIGQKEAQASFLQFTLLLWREGPGVPEWDDHPEWNQVLDQWRLTGAGEHDGVFHRIIKHAGKYPTFKALLYQMPARGENAPPPDAEAKAQEVLERREAEAKKPEAPLALPAPQGPRPINREESARKASSQRYRELREILNSKAERVNARGRKGVA